MPRIERYTKGIVRDRAVADLVDTSAIQSAGSTARALADVSGAAAEKVDKFAIAQETVSVNNAIINSKKQKLEFLEQARQQNIDNPSGFAKRIEPDLQIMDAQVEATLPTGRAKKAYRERMQELNFSAYADNFQWEKSRQVDMFAASVEDAAQNLGTLAYRRGQSGGGIDDLLNDAEATAVAGSTFVAPEKIKDIQQSTRKTIVEGYLNAVAERNPYLAQKMLNSGEYDQDLDAGYLRGQNIYIENKIKAAQAEVERAKLTQALLDVADSNTIADPGSKEHRSAINESFVNSGAAAAFANGDAAAGQELLTIYQRTSIIPEAAQSTLRGYMMNGNEEQKAAAYTFVGKLEEINPAALSGPGGFTEKEVADAAVYNQLIRSGATPQFSLNSVSARHDPLNADVRKQRETELTTIKKDNALYEIAKQKVDVTQDTGPWYDFSAWGTPDFMEGANRSRLMAQFDRIFSEEYLRSGSQESAAAAAAAVINRTAGITRIGGKKEVMEFAPEKFYSVDGLTPEENSKWISKEITDTVKQFVPKANAEEIKLVATPDSRNLVDAGMKPRYFAWYKADEYGNMDYVRGSDNLPVVLDFDQKIGAKKAAQKKAKEAIEASGYKQRDFFEKIPFISDWQRSKEIEEQVLKSEADTFEGITKDVLKNGR